MYRTFLKTKLHRATITAADPEYEGSVTVDRGRADGVRPMFVDFGLSGQIEKHFGQATSLRSYLSRYHVARNQQKSS